MAGFLDNLKVAVGVAKKDNTPANQNQQKTIKVLIVEDEKQLADALELKLNHEGFNVVRADNGESGLQKAQEFLPDVILLDLLMPVMDGKQMLKKLREIPQFISIPVIVLTNAGEVDNAHETIFYYNVRDFLIKSNTTLDGIVKKIRTVMV